MTHPLRQPGPVSLRRLFNSASFVGCADIAVSTVTEHSKHCTPGCLFAALPGSSIHGSAFLSDALQGGAAAILTDRPLAHVSLPQCIVADPRRAYAELCQALYGFPSRRLGLVGVTGTNGKTTTSWLVRSVLENSGHQAGVIGTIQYSDGVDAVPATLTTPDALTLARWLGAMEERRTRFGCLELSSHALDQGRSAGVSLDAAIVTNITQDHFDYHPDRHHYIRAKSRIAAMLKKNGVLILNQDDSGSRSVIDHLSYTPALVTFGIEQQADIQGVILEQDASGSLFRIEAGGEQVDCRTHLVGRHNIENCLAAAAALLHLGLSLGEVATGLAACTLVPGRLQRVEGSQPFQVMVDYAHTEDALHKIIQAVRPLTPGRVILVFGAGGNRDRAKRPAMGRVAGQADFCVLTSDNPRQEDPSKIIQEVLQGLSEVTQSCHLELDRRQAIEFALEMARPGDSVVIAGKGHERTQTIGSETLPFDDTAICREWLARHSHRFRDSDSPASVIPEPKFLQHHDALRRGSQKSI